MNNYHALPIILLVLLAYFATTILVKTKRCQLSRNRKIWNIILALFAGFSGLFGLILAISIDQKFKLSWYPKLLWVHVEFGIAFAIVALFHFSWHIKYYLLTLKKNAYEK
ncbi:MAG: hypothetical protein WCT08_02870 [Patescibacteria group bacterium]|jgi:hypothetical protein